MMSRDLERFVILPLVNCQKRGEVVSPHSPNLANQMIIIVNLDPSEKGPKCALKKWSKVTLQRLSERDEELPSFKGNPH